MRPRGRWDGRGWLALLVALAPAGCATESSYRPTEQVSAESQGRPAARYAVPPESPRGDVVIASGGVVSVEPRSGGDARPMVHVALTASNDNDDGDWTLDAREQRLFVGDFGGETPALAYTSAAPAPLVTISPGQRRTLDLFFPLPPGVKRHELPAFDLLWTVRTPLRPVAERTPFERDDDRPSRTYALVPSVALQFGWGGLWWYDPFFYPYFPGPIVIHEGGPRWHHGHGGHARRPRPERLPAPAQPAPTVPPPPPAEPTPAVPAPSVAPETVRPPPADAAPAPPAAAAPQAPADVTPSDDRAAAPATPIAPTPQAPSPVSPR